MSISDAGAGVKGVIRPLNSDEHLWTKRVPCCLLWHLSSLSALDLTSRCLSAESKPSQKLQGNHCTQKQKKQKSPQTFHTDPSAASDSTCQIMMIIVILADVYSFWHVVVCYFECMFCGSYLSKYFFLSLCSFVVFFSFFCDHPLKCLSSSLCVCVCIDITGSCSVFVSAYVTFVFLV